MLGVGLTALTWAQFVFSGRVLLLWAFLSGACVDFALGVGAVCGAPVDAADGPPGFLVLER